MVKLRTHLPFGILKSMWHSFLNLPVYLKLLFTAYKPILKNLNRLANNYFVIKNIYLKKQPLIRL